MTRSLKELTYLGVIIFLLNFLWEMGQAGLYRPHYEGTGEFIYVHFKAALGDMVLVAIIYLVTALILGKLNVKVNGKSLSVFSLTGLILAVVIEKYALSIGRWSYNDLMPIIPVLKVGLTPIIQLAILLPLSLYFVSKKPDS